MPRLLSDGWRWSPTLLSAAFAGAYLIIAPRSPDLAAHLFRAELFAREGFTIWNGLWYGGHHTPAYSVLSPPLGWLLTPQLMGALAAVGATAAFTELARGHWGARAARLGTIVFGAGSATMLFTNRLPFALGVAFAMAAALALQRGEASGTDAGSSGLVPRALAPLLAVLCALSSPVAALYLAMAGLASALAARGAGAGRRRKAGLAMGAAAFLTPVALNVAFPEGGYGPIVFGTYVAIPIFCLAAWLVIPPTERTLRIGLLLYVTGATLAFLLPTPVGNNAVRFGALMGAPVLACVIVAKGRWRPLVPLLGLLLALGVWQWSGAVRDLFKAFQDPVADAAYFDPVREYLDLLPDQRRVEIPFTFGHWEGAEVASEAPLARGWLRQLDTGHNPIFYKGGLNELTYASWLSENAVRYVALPDAKPDPSTYRERALIERGLPYLKLRATFDHWRVYEVTLPAPMVIPEGDANIVLEQLGSDEVLLRVIEPGEATVRVRWTHYWLAEGGCVERDGDWTRVTATKKGFLRLVTSFSPERIVDRGRRCNGI
ncbi:MFS transporter [soil metagenome]